MKKICLFILIILSMTCVAQEVKKVLFIGDSITDGGWGNSGGSDAPSEKRNHWDMNHIYGHSYMFLCAAHYQGNNPENNFKFFNRGISGNTLNELEARWQKDVIQLAPDVVSILIGTNDATVFQRRKSQQVFNIREWEERYRKLLDQTLQELPHVKFVLCTPFVACTGKLGKSNEYPLRKELVEEYAEAINRIAADYRAVIVPFDKMFENLLKKYPIEGEYWIWDGIHPTPAGHHRMAKLWIKCADSIVKK